MVNYKQQATRTDDFPINLEDIDIEGVDIPNVGNISVQEGKRVGFGGVSGDTYLIYNIVTSELELWTNGVLEVSW